MRLEDCYRLFDLEPKASDEELRNAYRDLTKVWHPDRFAHDPSLRRKSEEQLKKINEAYETIRAARAGGWRPSDATREAPPAPSVEQLRDRTIRRYRTWMLTCAIVAIIILFRRPTPAGLILAAVLFAFAGVLVARMRKLLRG
jgi:hypothetical protein